MIKKLLLTLAAVFLAYQSYRIISQIDIWQGNAIWLDFLFAWILNMMITGIFAFTGFAFPTQKLLPESYYTVKHPKSLKKWNKRLGLDYFRKLLLATVWRKKEQQKKYFNGRRDGLQHFITQSKKSEFGHLFPFWIVNALCVYLLYLGLYPLAIFTLIWNIIGNFYPILLQREHRMRIQNIYKRLARKA